MMKESRYVSFEEAEIIARKYFKKCVKEAIAETFDFVAEEKNIYHKMPKEAEDELVLRYVKKIFNWYEYFEDELYDDVKYTVSRYF